MLSHRDGGFLGLSGPPNKDDNMIGYMTPSSCVRSLKCFFGFTGTAWRGKGLFVCHRLLSGFVGQKDSS